MTWLIDFITERPVLFVRYVCYIVIAIVMVVGLIAKSSKKKRKMKLVNRATLFTDKIDANFGVSIFYGEDGCYRFIPLVRNRFGVYVPIEEGVEIPPTTDAEQVGEGYIAAAVNSLNHYGEDLDVRKATALYKSFKKFTSQKKFDLTHCRASSIAKNSEIKFTYTVWHDGEFCLKKGDPSIEKIVSLQSNATEIGNAILTVFEDAKKAFPNNTILNITNKMYPARLQNLAGIFCVKKRTNKLVFPTCRKNIRKKY